MKKTATLLTALALLLLVSAAPATARSTEDLPSPTGTRADSSRSVVVVRATGLLQRRVMTTYQYGTHRVIDVKTRRPYALKSSRYPALLDRHVGGWVTVYGVRVPGFPRKSGPPLLDVFRVVPPVVASPV